MLSVKRMVMELTLPGRYCRRVAAVGIYRYLQATVQCQLFENIVHMVLDRVYGDGESPGDFLVAEPSGNQHYDLALTSSALLASASPSRS